MKPHLRTDLSTWEPGQAGGPEFGLFVVWPDGRSHDAFVLDHIAGTFQIVEVTECAWSPELSAAAYARFSQVRLVPPYQPSMVRDRGVGRALIVAVLDTGPKPQVAASGVPQPIDPNHRVRRVREELAERIGSHPVHAAADEQQAVREYMLLLERDAADTVRTVEWNGEIHRDDRDLAGTGGWIDVRRMFRALNAGAPYVVLRNFEGLADLEFLPGHTDIDILTSDYLQTISMLGAVSRLKALPRWGGRFDVGIGSRSVICDLRFPGDRYYEDSWARAILENRRLHPDGFYVPDDAELLDTMLYHAVVHKPEVRADYQVRLAALARRLNRSGWEEEALGDREGAQSILGDRLAARRFRIERPKDPTVYFNHRVRRVFAPIVWRALDALKRRIYRFSMRHLRYPLRLVGLTVWDRMERPMATLRRLGSNSSHLPKPSGR